jgi:hypothetical protein
VDATAETFLFTTRRQPPELVVALGLISKETVCINWSMAWKQGDNGVLIELDNMLRRTVFDLVASGMAVPEQVYAEIYTEEHGEPMQAARMVISSEGRRLLNILEGTV